MSILMVATQVDVLIWGALCESHVCYSPRSVRLPRSVWCNKTSLPKTHVDPCRIAVEAAEYDLITLNRLLQATSVGIRDWWEGAGRNGSIIMTVWCSTKHTVAWKSERFRVKLPVLPKQSEDITLEPMQFISVDNIGGHLSVRVRVGLGYVLARAMGTVLGGRKSKGHKVQRGKKADAILKMTAFVIDCLASGDRMFEIREAEWTKEIKSLVHTRWGWRGVFQIREDNAASRSNERCIVILFDPARITESDIT
jgi:hypothetical protein